MKHSWQREGEDFSLSPLTESQALQLRKLRNAIKDCFINTDYITEQQQLRWFKKYCETENDFMFAIFVNGNLAGQAGLYNINQASGECELGRIMLADYYRGRGLGSRIVRELCDLAFSELSMWRLELEVLESNIPALVCYENAGFCRLYSAELDDGRKIVKMERIKS